MPSFALSPDEWTTVLLALRVALVATFAALPVALLVAWLLARGRFWGRALLEAVVHQPLVLPPGAIGYLLLLAFGEQGPAAAFLRDKLGLSLGFRWTGAALAAAVMAFPLMVRPIRLSLEMIDGRLAQAAKTLGANRAAIFRTVTLPLALPGIIAGAMLGFARALGEFGATVTFVGNIPGETQTLAGAITALIQAPGDKTAALRLCAIAVAISFVALLVSEWLTRRALRRMHGA